MKQFPVIREVEKDKLTEAGGDDGEVPDTGGNLDQEEPAYEMTPGKTVRVDEGETFA